MARPFFRLKPLGMTIGTDGSRPFGVSSFTVGNQHNYSGVPMPWPGVWTIQGIGGGGGGGGNDTFYNPNGEAGGFGSYFVTNPRSITRTLSLSIGIGGAPGINSQTGTPTAGSPGGTSSVPDSTGTVSNFFGGPGGRAGVNLTNYNRTPVNSLWPNTIPGRGGFGAPSATSGQNGGIRMTLKG